MLSLAETLPYDHPPAFYLSFTPGSTIIKRLVWYWLAHDIRIGYAAASHSYVSFCKVHNEKPWPAQTIILEEWAATRIFGSTFPKHGQIKPDTALSYLSALKSFHNNRGFSLENFDDPWMALIIKSGRRLFPSKKRNRLPITEDIFEKITEKELFSIAVLNVDTAFKLA